MYSHQIIKRCFDIACGVRRISMKNDEIVSELKSSTTKVYSSLIDCPLLRYQRTEIVYLGLTL